GGGGECDRARVRSRRRGVRRARDRRRGRRRGGHGLRPGPLAAAAGPQPRTWHAAHAGVDGSFRGRHGRGGNRGEDATEGRPGRGTGLTELSQVDFSGEDVVVARITGEIDLSNAAEVGDRIAAAVPNTALGVVIDLTATSYL